MPALVSFERDTPESDLWIAAFLTKLERSDNITEATTTADYAVSALQKRLISEEDDE